MSYRALAIAVALLACFSRGSRAEEPMLYVIEGDQVLFTNVPGHAGARPVPGFSVRRSVKTSATRLPATMYDPYIERVARENGLSAELIKAVALVESGLDPHAVSPKGAQGLMQLMPDTARRYGVADAFNPRLTGCVVRDAPTPLKYSSSKVPVPGSGVINFEVLHDTH